MYPTRLRTLRLPNLVDVFDNLSEAIHFLPPYAISNITLHSFIVERHVLLLSASHGKLTTLATIPTACGAAYLVLLLFAQRPVPSADSAGEGQAVPGCPARRRVEE